MNESASDKTEEPTPKKLRDARKKGQVLQVKDMASLATFFMIFMTVVFLGHDILGLMINYLKFSIELMKVDSESNIPIAIETAAYFFASGSIILGFLYAITAIAVKVAEVGLLFSTEPLKIEFKKLNPVEGFKRIYSKKSLVEFGKSFLKSFTLIILVWVVYVTYSRDIINVYNCDKSCLFPLLSEVLSAYIISIILVFLFITIIDYWIQAAFFKKSMMMTKDEVKREYKESEGSPEIKGERKRVHREIMNSSEAPKKSSFVVTNPTHYSIAFLFDRDQYKIPYVYIKGVNDSALNIRRSAREANIPIVENIQLARALYAEVDQFEYIPPHFFKPLSDIIAGLVKTGALTLPNVSPVISHNQESPKN